MVTVVFGHLEVWILQRWFRDSKPTKTLILRPSKPRKQIGTEENTLEITVLMQEYGVVTGEQKYIEIERMSDLRKNPLN